MALTLAASEIGISLKQTSQDTFSGSTIFFWSIILLPPWNLYQTGMLLCALSLTINVVAVAADCPVGVGGE